MNRRILLAATALAAVTAPLAAQTFNGAADNQVDSQDYYYALSGGKFVNGQTRDGTTGVMQYISDEPYWGVPLDTWYADSWFTQTAGIAMTMKNGASIVYDNNGIEDGSYGTFYTEGSPNNAGLVRGYSNSNNYDWMYAGYFTLDAPTTFTQLIAYFDGNGYYNDGSFDPALFDYRMNIFSSVNGSPMNTGSFLGDVLTTANTAGSFAYSNTSASRLFTTNTYYPAGTTDPIWRLVWTPDNAITLAAGDYFFSSDGLIPTPEVVPEPATLTLLASGLAGMAAARRRKRVTKG